MSATSAQITAWGMAAIARRFFETSLAAAGPFSRVSRMSSFEIRCQDGDVPPGRRGLVGTPRTASCVLAGTGTGMSSENLMKYLSFVMFAGAAGIAAAPASAQTTYDPYPTTYGNAQANQNTMQSRIATLNARLQAGIDTGAITRAEARPIRQQIRYLAQLEQRYSADGLTKQERRDLQQRFRYTRQQLRAADPNNARYAQWDRQNYDP